MSSTSSVQVSPSLLRIVDEPTGYKTEFQFNQVLINGLDSAFTAQSNSLAVSNGNNDRMIVLDLEQKKIYVADEDGNGSSMSTTEHLLYDPNNSTYTTRATSTVHANTVNGCTATVSTDEQAIFITDNNGNASGIAPTYNSISSTAYNSEVLTNSSTIIITDRTQNKSSQLSVNQLLFPEGIDASIINANYISANAKNLDIWGNQNPSNYNEWGSEIYLGTDHVWLDNTNGTNTLLFDTDGKMQYVQYSNNYPEAGSFDYIVPPTNKPKWILDGPESVLTIENIIMDSKPLPFPATIGQLHFDGTNLYLYDSTLTWRQVLLI
jgi:hypothetical protein